MAVSSISMPQSPPCKPTSTGPNPQYPVCRSEVTPIVHSDATGEQLGIVELTSEATTYFYGSPPERMHNIAQAAANFYGIVVAPGELFSFNKYLGEISEEQGYTQGLIIVDGRTIEGIGGGVRQVSTTCSRRHFGPVLILATVIITGIACIITKMAPSTGLVVSVWTRPSSRPLSIYVYQQYRASSSD